MKNIKCRATLSYVYNLGEQTIQNVTNSNLVEGEYREVIIRAKKFIDATFFKPGDIITHTLILSNVGTFQAESLVIEEDISSQNLLTSSVHIYSLDEFIYEFYEKDNLFIVNIANLNPDQTVVINFQTIVSETIELEKEIRNKTKITIDKEIENYTNEVSVKQKYAKLLCHKTPIGVIYPNVNFEYVLNIENIGNENALNVEISDQLPANFVLEHLYFNDEEINEYLIENGLLKCKIPLVSPKQKVYLRVVGLIAKGYK